jgi:hypothetical protein
MYPKNTKHSGIDPNDKALKQQFYSVGISKGQIYGKQSSKERINTSGIKKIKTNSSTKTFGGNIMQNQIGKLRVSSGGRSKPGVSNITEKKLKYILYENPKSKRKSGAGSHSRNQVFQIQGGSQTGRSYNKSNTREYSPNNLSKSPKNSQISKKSRNSRIMGSQTHIAAKRRPSKKLSKDMEVIKVVKNPDKSKKDSIFLMYQKYPRMTKTGSMGYSSRGQSSALSPKITKQVKTSGISGMEKYMLKVNPSKISDSRGDKKMINYPHSLGSEGSKSKEDLRYVPVENISLFDEANIPLSARNPQNTRGLSLKISNVGSIISQIKFFRYFKIIKLFKVWSGYTRKQKYIKKRIELAQNLPWGKQFFVPFISGAIEPLNEIRY